MKSIVLGGIVLAAALLVGSVIWVRSDVTLEATPLPTTTFEKVDTDTGQFLHEAPHEPLSSPVAVEASPTANLSVTTPVTIIIDESGFSPSTVTVAAGTTVTFVNNGQAPHWPASDGHPVHSILPEFDPKRSLATGEEYSFTFTKVGTWGFHDHLQSRSVGVVTVK